MKEDDPPAAPLNLVDLMDRLVEPAEPAPVSMMPETAGWTILAAILALVLAWLVWRGWHRWQANAYRRAALAELDEAGDDPVAVAAILRRTALAAWPREQIASLSGKDWLRFLDATGGEGFVEGVGAALADAPYRVEKGHPVAGLGTIAARWVRAHRVARTPEPAP